MIDKPISTTVKWSQWNLTGPSKTGSKGAKNDGQSRRSSLPPSSMESPPCRGRNNTTFTIPI